MDRTYFGIWFHGSEDEESGWCSFQSHDPAEIDCCETLERAEWLIKEAGVEGSSYEPRMLPSNADCVLLRVLLAAVEGSMMRRSERSQLDS
jgi:hypothetical protein